METPPRSEFSAEFVLVNALAERHFEKWSFRPGMLFGDKKMWWGERRTRPNPHEGLDLAFFLDKQQSQQQLAVGHLVPPLQSGLVKAIIPDLLGRTIIVEHCLANDLGLRLYALYAHLEPDEAISPGREVGSGTILGTIAPGSRNCPAHLHISTAWGRRDIPLATFSWADHSRKPIFTFIDPMEFL